MFFSEYLWTLRKHSKFWCQDMIRQWFQNFSAHIWYFDISQICFLILYFYFFRWVIRQIMSSFCVMWCAPTPSRFLKYILTYQYLLFTYFLSKYDKDTGILEFLSSWREYLRILRPIIWIFLFFRWVIRPIMSSFCVMWCAPTPSRARPLPRCWWRTTSRWRTSTRSWTSSWSRTW